MSVIKLIGIIVLIEGFIFSLNPHLLIKFLKFFREGKRVYYIGILRILLGLLFIFNSAQCKSKYIISIIGVLTLAGGVFTFILKLSKIKAIFDWWLKKSYYIFQILSFFILFLGSIIFYFG